jgi:hypothetical protein
MLKRWIILRLPPSAWWLNSFGCDVALAGTCLWLEIAFPERYPLFLVVAAADWSKWAIVLIAAVAKTLSSVLSHLCAVHWHVSYLNLSSNMLTGSIDGAFRYPGGPAVR